MKELADTIGCSVMLICYTLLCIFVEGFLFISLLFIFIVGMLIND